MELTKQEAIKNHREMWNWIAEQYINGSYKHIEELGETTTKDVILNYCDLDDKTRQLLKVTKFVYTYLVFDLDLQDGNEDERKVKTS